MNKLKIIGKEEMVLIDIHKISIDVVADILFCKNLGEKEKTIYVIDEMKLRGIITLGDIRRYLRGEKADFVNKEFMFFVKDEEDKVYQLFEERQAINSIPIVDKGNRLLYEYIRNDKTDDVSQNRLFNIKYFFEFLLENNIFEILCLERDHQKWISSLLKQFDMKSIRCEYTKLRYLSSIIKENSLVICSKIDLDKIIKINNNSIIMPYDQFDFLMYSPWVKDWRNLLMIWCRYVSRYKKEYFIFSKRSTVISKKVIACLEKYMPIILINSIDDIKKNSEILILDIGQREDNIKERKDIALSFIEDFIVQCLNINQMYQILAVKFIPIWKKKRVHIVAIEDPSDRSLLRDNDRSCMLPADVFETEKEELEAVFGRDISEILAGKEITILMRGKGKERIEKHIINENLPTIFLFGPCIIFGTFVKAEETISSILQDKIGNTMCVRNMASTFWGEMISQMEAVSYKEGDIVLFFKHKEFLNDVKIPIVNIKSAYNNDWKNNVWDNLLHCNSKIMKNIAYLLYDNLLKLNFLSLKGYSGERKEKRFWLKKSQKNNLIENWFDEICTSYSIADNVESGAIVMNCNPFTIGHKYLVQTASSQVKILYVFVVSENKSRFDFSARYQMVKLGTQEFDNVIVLPSGPYIISSDTMNGYFIKDKLQSIHPIECYMTDLRIFGAVIAPKFGINTRFVGEEPADLYTNSYNQALKEILPDYGVKVIEIPRICIDGKVVSASEVRKLLEKKEFDKLAKFVPDTTLTYLLKNKY